VRLNGFLEEAHWFSACPIFGGKKAGLPRKNAVLELVIDSREGYGYQAPLMNPSKGH